MASLAFKYYKIKLRPRLRPGPRWRSLRRSPRSTPGEGLGPLQRVKIWDVST